MGTVPDAYYQFVMHYAPWFYVITTAMTADPPAGQKNVTVADGTKFSAGMPCEIKDSAHSEWNEVDSIAGNVVTMKNNLAYAYYVAKGGTVDHGDKSFGKGAFPAAFAIEFLSEAYSVPQFASLQATILAKIVDLADWLLTQQCTDNLKKAYGGFKSGESSTQYYAIDAGRVIPALLKAYALIGTSGYLDAAKLAGYTFLYTMQQQPSILGVHDKYYGGFANYVTFDYESGGETGEWISPTGHSDPWEQWEFEDRAYDENLGTFASNLITGIGWSGYLILTLPSSILCDKVRFNAKYEESTISQIDVDVFKDGVWTDVYQGAFENRIWIEKPFTRGSVTQMRIRFYSEAEYQDALLYEVDFWKITELPPVLIETWDTIMSIENLYCLIGLKALADTYDVANASRYNGMMADAAGFLKVGFEQLYLYYQPPPSGSGVWYRVGLNDTEVYDDPVSFALLGLYIYESWSLTCQRVYNFVQAIRASGQYPAYWPEICWPGYLDVVTRFPACAYYDAITTGILWKIRKERDPPSFKLAYQVVEKYSDKFLYWGPIFTDYSPITPQKAMANVTWLARMFLNYEEPLTRFTRILNSKGEAVLLYPVRQAVETVSYGEPLDVLAVVSPVRVEEVLLEAGYLLNDYLAFYTFIPVRHHDKIRRKGEDYEIQTLQPFTYENQTIYFKSIARRLLAT